MKLKTLAALACGAALVGSAFSQEVEELNLGFDVTSANANGVLAGMMTDEDWFTQGAFLAMGNLVAFAVPDSDFTMVLDVNNASTMVGATWMDSDYHGFLRKMDGTILTYQFPGAQATTFNAVTDGGKILGWQYTGFGNYGDFILDRNGQATMISIPGYPDAGWYDMNNRGQLMGSWYGGDEGIIGLLYTAGRVEEIAYPDAGYTVLVDLNNRGDVLGEATMPWTPDIFGSESRAFVRKADGTIATIDYQPEWPETIQESRYGEVEDLEFYGTLGTRARAIDDSGRVVFVALAAYVKYGPYGVEFGTVKERIFATRP